jgi:hypothetical protein
MAGRGWLVLGVLATTGIGCDDGAAEGCTKVARSETVELPAVFGIDWSEFYRGCNGSWSSGDGVTRITLAASGVPEYQVTSGRRTLCGGTFISVEVEGSVVDGSSALPSCPGSCEFRPDSADVDWPFHFQLNCGTAVSGPIGRDGSRLHLMYPRDAELEREVAP